MYTVDETVYLPSMYTVDDTVYLPSMYTVDDWELLLHILCSIPQIKL